MSQAIMKRIKWRLEQQYKKKYKQMDYYDQEAYNRQGWIIQNNDRYTELYKLIHITLKNTVSKGIIYPLDKDKVYEVKAHIGFIFRNKKCTSIKIRSESFQSISLPHIGTDNYCLGEIKPSNLDMALYTLDKAIEKIKDTLETVNFNDMLFQRGNWPDELYNLWPEEWIRELLEGFGEEYYGEEEEDDEH